MICLETKYMKKIDLTNYDELEDAAIIQKLQAADTLDCEELNLNYTNAADLSKILADRFPKLKRLYLQATNVADISWLVEDRYPDLEELYLGDTKITDINNLSSFKKIKKLYLTGTKINNVSALEKLRSIEELSISDTEVFNLSPLVNLTNLCKLYLTNLDLNASSLFCLVNLKNLKVLSVDDTSELLATKHYVLKEIQQANEEEKKVVASTQQKNDYIIVLQDIAWQIKDNKQLEILKMSKSELKSVFLRQIADFFSQQQSFPISDINILTEFLNKFASESKGKAETSTLSFREWSRTIEKFLQLGFSEFAAYLCDECFSYANCENQNETELIQLQLKCYIKAKREPLETGVCYGRLKKISPNTIFPAEISVENYEPSLKISNFVKGNVNSDDLTIFPSRAKV
jgi:hypothetical protein